MDLAKQRLISVTLVYSLSDPAGERDELITISGAIAETSCATD